MDYCRVATFSQGKLGCRKRRFPTVGRRGMDCTRLGLQEGGSWERPLTPLRVLRTLLSSGGQQQQQQQPGTPTTFATPMSS